MAIPRRALDGRQRGRAEGIDIVDHVAPVLLNVTQGYGVEIVSNLLVVVPVVNEVMRQVPADVSFWMLPAGHCAVSSRIQSWSVK